MRLLNNTSWFSAFDLVSGGVIAWSSYQRKLIWSMWKFL